MVCEKFDKLSHYEKIIFIGELVHICQTNDKYLEICTEIINKAREEGVLDRVTILPEILTEQETNIE